MLRRSGSCRIIPPLVSPVRHLTRLLATHPIASPPFRHSRTAAVLPLVAVDGYQALRQFTHILDARSPDEFNLDRILLARNTPVLSNIERQEVGTLHKTNVFAARLRGASLISKNISSMLPQLGLSANCKVLVYCWRGGERSKSFAHILARIGCQVSVLDGGYKAYRALVRSFLHYNLPHSFFVVGGLTGVGKGKVLSALRSSGEQVLDLEDLGKHRGSAFGTIPGVAQPSQALFESHVFDVISEFDTTRPVFVESESAKLGRLTLPPLLWEKMKSCALRFAVPASLSFRVKNIRSQYGEYERDPQLLAAALGNLTVQHGKAKVAEWTRQGANGQWDELVAELLLIHYDFAYEKSTRRSNLVPEIVTPALNESSESTSEVVRFITESANAKMKAGQ